MKDLVVIGGGVGGLVTASVAGRLGLDVALIEREDRLGGGCLHHGCVPSKSLIRSADVAALMRRGETFGLPRMDPVVDLGTVNDRVRSVIDAIQVRNDPARFRGYGIDVRFGEARFINPREVEVKGERLRARRLVIATGSRPVVPPIPGLIEAGYLSNEQVFELRELPGHLVVLGGGPVGVELAQSFLRLGSRVTLLEMAPEILPREEPSMSAELRRLLVTEGLDIRTATRVDRVAVENGRKCVYARSDGEHIPVEADAILVAAGRAPDVESLALGRAGVEHDENGIRVDASMRTNQRHIFACGDVCGAYPFTHMAEYQAGIIISNAVFRLPRKADYRVVPRVIHCDPEFARVGLTGEEARALYPDARVLRLPFRDIDRALAEGEPMGSMQLIIRRRRILGATIVGPRAGELLHEIVLAMQAKVRVGDIAAAIHAYPTLARIHSRIVDSHHAETLFSARTRALVRWINRLLP